VNGTATSTTQLNRLNVIQGGGKKLPLTFSDTEFERRLVALRATMEAENLDAVVVTSCHGIKYYSDFLLTSVGWYALVVTPEEHVVVTADIDAGMPWRRSYGENIVYAGGRGALQNGVHGVLRQHGIRPRRLGVECDALTVNDYAQLQSVFEEAQLVDIASAATRHRMIKSAEEIEVIKEGARIADLGAEAIRSAICEDMTEFEIALIGTEEMACEIGRTFPDSELRDTWVWLQSGINTDGPHNWPTTRRLREGDILSVGCFPVISGYQAALKRTLFLGEPDARSLELWTANVEVHRRGLELIKPGAVCDEIATELREIYLSHGVIPNRAFGNGCPIGVLSRYYGRQVDLDLREDRDVVLEPGMVVSMEPIVTVPDGQPGAGGYRERDTLIVGDDGAENITGYPLGPEHRVLPC
jgi:creatinase